MKKLAHLSLSYAALLLALSACNKVSNDPTPAASRTALLTSHLWKPSAGTVVSTSTVSGQPVPIPTRDTFDTCDKDDSFTFRADNTLVADQGATKCTPADPQQETGTWAFTNGEQNLTFTAAGQPVFFDGAQIKELSATTLHLAGAYTQSYTGPTGISYTISFTYDAIFVAQ